MILKISLDCIEGKTSIETDKGIYEWKYYPKDEEGITTELERVIEMIRPGTLEFLNFSKKGIQKEISPG